jgi:tRNA(Ile)-lysidine synthase
VTVRYHHLERTVERFVERHGLLEAGDRILVAVSGGPDSVALLLCLNTLRDKWSWDLLVGHVDHGIRGEESAEDAIFVKTLAENLGIPSLIHPIRIQKAEVRQSRKSLQEFARERRYLALKDMALEVRAAKIALGHQADDQAETVLMWMMRGSGTGGLSGMPPRRGRTLVRPLLDQTRSDILDYLAVKGAAFRTDSTNAHPIYLRNRVRGEIIPFLEQYSPGIVKVLSRQAHILREDHAYLEGMAQEVVQRHGLLAESGQFSISRAALLALPLSIRRRVIRLGLQRFWGNSHWPRFDVVEHLLGQIESGHSGWVFDWQGVSVKQEYDQVVILSRQSMSGVLQGESVPEMILTIPGEVTWPWTGQRVRLESTGNGELGNASLKEFRFDRDTFTLPLILRSWQPGDRFCPGGFGGKRKKLQDYFSDIKLPRAQRHRIPLLVAPEGILCVGGVRSDERFQVSASTTSVLVVKIS